MEIVKSPLNYTGNKYRTINQMQGYFPNQIDNMVDLFCGGATVGLNTKCKRVVFIDSNEKVINLLKYLASCDFFILIDRLEEVIDKYGLTFSARDGYCHYKQDTINVEYNPNNGLKPYNSVGFYQIRDKYNSLDPNSEEANILLYLLMVYGFNNDIRFSKDGKFNLPVGKTDLNKNNIAKLKNYIERVNSIDAQFICGDFRSSVVQCMVSFADFIYMDPPYLITDAVYNESGGWNLECEQSLIALLQELLDSRKQFALSNILEKKSVRNELLLNWIVRNQNKVDVIDINSHYRNASYNKKEREAQEREIVVIPKKKS